MLEDSKDILEDPSNTINFFEVDMDENNDLNEENRHL
jgi:hypothetical protein